MGLEVQMGLHNWVKHLGHVIWEENDCFLPDEEEGAESMMNRQADCDKFQFSTKSFLFFFLQHYFRITNPYPDFLKHLASM